MSEFKKGDKIRCLKNFHTEFTRGKIYEVKKYPGRFGFVEVVKDDRGAFNGWAPKNFELFDEDLIYSETIIRG